MERPFGHDVGPAGPTTWAAGCYLPLYKSHSFLAALGLQHNTRQPPELEIPEAKFVIEFPLVEAVLEKESVRKFGLGSSAKILRENWRGAAKI